MKAEFSSIELLKFAITIEEEGVKFYEANAELAEGNNKVLLLRLASDEKQHAAVFQKIYDEIDDQSGFDDYLYDFDVKSLFHSYANNEVFAKRKTTINNINDVLKIAAETEKITVDYYTDLLEYAKDGLKEILERLINEEQEHYNKIMDLIAL